MFKKLPQEMLTDANEALQQEVMSLRKELWHRAAPRVTEMITAFGPLINAAENGDHSAKALLHEFFTTWRRAEALSTMADPNAKRPVKFEAPVGADESAEPVIVNPTKESELEHPIGEDGGQHI